MRFLTFEQASEYIRGRSVALVGSAPTCLENLPGFIDEHEVVVRVNNYKVDSADGPLGRRTDIHYSFYGNSIRKSVHELKRDGVKLCWCKCPNSKPLESVWHERHKKMNGIDFRYIYDLRRDWWFCDTYVPQAEQFLKHFTLLNRHVPTTGFAALLDILACEPRSVYMTGFDFFESGIHNVNEHWRAGDPTDPIGHAPMREFAWLREHAHLYPIQFDAALTQRLVQKEVATA